MEVVVQRNPELAGRLAARLVAKLIHSKPNAVLGLATGSTPLPLYKELIRLHKDEGLDFSRVTTFNLDEYAGLPANHPCSYMRHMEETLFKHINLRRRNVHIPNGMARDMARECIAYEKAILDADGIDLQILGIGRDGHIGFNEPSSSMGSRTRVKTLMIETIRDNARFFGRIDEVPRNCITIGIGTILEAKQLLLLAFGAHKAGIVSKAIEGPITSMIPASVLQLHPDVKIFLDTDASAKLKRRSYYKWAYDNKPEWERF
jgi:glucosamine-6-phosphate deaminase